MIECNIPEINVQELMQEIRNQVARRKDIAPCVSATSSRMNEITVARTNHLETLLKDAEYFSQVPTKLPDKLNRFPINVSKRLHNFVLKLYGFLFKKQRVVNFSLIQVLRDSLVLNQQLVVQIDTLQTQLSTMEARLIASEEQLQQQLRRISQEIGNRLATNELQLQSVNELQGVNERLTSTETCLKGVSQQLSINESRISVSESQLLGLDTRMQGLDNRIVAVDERYIRNDSYLKNDLAQQKRLITLFLEEAQKRLPEAFTQEEVQIFYREEKHSLDALYIAFEDQFRGSRNEIVERLNVYLPLIAEAKVGTPELPILDVGCGRGEWLELLRESEYMARGLDINRVALDLCRARQLEVVEADVISYLRELPDTSLGAITGFHIIEHLPFEALVNLFHEAARVLKPGGLVIFETPNPQNVLVGSCNFYLDPTHRNPLPSLFMKFLAESCAFNKVQILNLHPWLTARLEDNSELAKRFNEYFYGSMDYALIGYRL